MRAPVAMSAGPCPTPVEVIRHGHLSYARCLARSCAACGVLWLGDTRVKVLAACQTLTSPVALVTVTAPGKDVLPWSNVPGRVEPSAARWWNATAPERWSALHREARRLALAVSALRPEEFLQLCRVWEYQKRGVLHLHLVVPFGSPDERDTANEYVAWLAELAPAYGFGFVDRGRLPSTGRRLSSRSLVPVLPHRAAAYVAGYIVSCGAGKPGVAEVARRQGVPGPIVHVAAPLAKKSGVTMRTLRMRRRVLTSFPDAATDPIRWRAACLVDALSRRRAPLTPGTKAALYAEAVERRAPDVIDSARGRWLSPTPAAAPPAVLEAVAVPAGGRGRWAVRLDPVLHRGNDGTGASVIWEAIGALR